MKLRILIAVIALGSALLPSLAGSIEPTSPVPEPASFLLVGGGLAAAILITRKRLRK
jgi:hypothetical protein